LELKAIAEKLQAPVTMTLQGLGAFPESHKLSLGMLGMHGTWYANMAVHHADLLVAIGARFDDRVTGKVESFAPEAKIIHIDIDPAAISKNVVVDLPIVGDVKTVLSKVIPLLEKRNPAEWLKTIDVWKKEHPLRYHRTAELSAQEVIQELSNATQGNAIVITDVGQHQMWTAQFYKYMYPRTNITSGGLGTMGFSLPAAIGVSAARQDLPVISISGDGGFQMNMQEMGTILEYDLPIKIFIINNGFLGMVRQWQDLFWKKRYSAVEMKNPDFVKLADAYGCPAVRVSSREQLGPAIKAALAHKGAYFVEFVVAMEDNVYPMIPAGQSVDEMMELPAELPTPSSIVVKG
jgi:acetolactate synthase-1/2/3 large subunit